MTKDEIREFVEKTINADPTWADEYSVWEGTVAAIVEKWEEDVQDNRDEAYQSGVHVGQESMG